MREHIDNREESPLNEIFIEDGLLRMGGPIRMIKAGEGMGILDLGNGTQRYLCQQIGVDDYSMFFPELKERKVPEGMKEFLIGGTIAFLTLGGNFYIIDRNTNRYLGSFTLQ